MDTTVWHYLEIRELWTVLCGIISLGFVTKNVGINMSHIYLSN